jgi:hypothetical protein
LGALGAAWQFDPLTDFNSRASKLASSFYCLGKIDMIYKGKIVFTVLAVLILILVVVNVLLSLGNQSLRVEVSQRQQFITQSIQLEGLHREIVTTLASIAMKTNDGQLKNLLASQGINLGANPGQAGSTK